MTIKLKILTLLKLNSYVDEADHEQEQHISKQHIYF